MSSPFQLHLVQVLYYTPTSQFRSLHVVYTSCLSYINYSWSVGCRNFCPIWSNAFCGLPSLDEQEFDISREEVKYAMYKYGKCS